MSLYRNARWTEIAALLIEQQRDDKQNAGLREFDSVSYEDAGLEESRQQPLWGNTDVAVKPDGLEGGVCEYVAWFSDGEDSRYETN